MTNKPDRCREAFEAREIELYGFEPDYGDDNIQLIYEAYKAAHDAQQAKIDHIKTRLVQIASGDWRNGDDSAEALALDALKYINETLTKESGKDGN